VKINYPGIRWASPIQFEVREQDNTLQVGIFDVVHLCKEVFCELLVEMEYSDTFYIIYYICSENRKTFSLGIDTVISIVTNFYYWLAYFFFKELAS